MAEFKLVISDPKLGKSKQVEVKEAAAKGLIGKKIGDTFKGEIVDMPGYEFQITGGSDYAGFPMRGDVQGQGRKKITDVKSLGVKNKRHRPNPKKKGMRTINGMRLKKSVAGNTIYEKSAQINLKILKTGRDPLFEEPKAEEAPAAEKPAAAPEAPKSEPKKEDIEENEEETDDAPSSPDGEDVGGAADAMSSPEEKEATPKETTAPADDDDSESVEKETEEIEKEIAKDEEELKKEDEEIEAIEKELKEAESGSDEDEDKKEE